MISFFFVESPVLSSSLCSLPVPPSVLSLFLTSCFILVAVGIFISLYFLCHFLHPFTTGFFTIPNYLLYSNVSQSECLAPLHLFCYLKLLNFVMFGLFSQTLSPDSKGQILHYTVLCARPAFGSCFCSPSTQMATTDIFTWTDNVIFLINTLFIQPSSVLQTF